ncbi:MAG: chromate efflux transporter [Myxococcaceae bacterium]
MPPPLLPPPAGRLAEVAAVFLRLGATAFGGPLSHLALMREELVRKRAWVDERTFLDFLSLANLLPGPTSTEVAMQLGRARGGRWGLVVAGACFILPAALLVAALAALYVRFGLRPETQAVLASVQPVVVALVATAILPLARTTLRASADWALFALALAALWAGANPVLVLAGTGLLALLLASGRGPALALSLPQGWLLLAAPASVGLVPLFWAFLKIGAVVLGSGYVLVAFLQADLVDGLHWLSSAQLLDAVAVGQVTPGPVFTTATFIGFLLRGPAGAAVATLAVFLPAFLAVLMSGGLLPRLRKEARARAFLDGVNAASLALMAQVTLVLGRATVVDVPSALLCGAALLLLLGARANGSLVVLAAALVGLVRGHWG